MRRRKPPVTRCHPRFFFHFQRAGLHVVLTRHNPSVYSYYCDGLGSVIALSNTSRQIAEQYRYDAFGNTKAYNASGGLKYLYQLIDNPYMFTGRRLDPETFEATPDSMGLYYYRARMYNPQLGRFMQPDPIGYYDAMNLYQYCGNNPVNWIDPWGLKAYVIFIGRNTEGFSERAVRYQKRRIKKGDDYDPEKDQIIVREISRADDMAGVLKNTKDIKEIIYIGHAFAKGLYVDPDICGVSGANITANGGQIEGASASVSVNTLATDNVRSDARIYLLGCNVNFLKDNIGKSFANHFSVPVYGAGTTIKFNDDGKPYTNINQAIFYGFHWQEPAN